MSAERGLAPRRDVVQSSLGEDVRGCERIARRRWRSDRLALPASTAATSRNSCPMPAHRREWHPPPFAVSSDIRVG